VFFVSLVCGPLKRNEVTGGWRELHNEELHNVYSAPYTESLLNVDIACVPETPPPFAENKHKRVYDTRHNNRNDGLLFLER
jgi:hypothetical protein